MADIDNKQTFDKIQLIKKKFKKMSKTKRNK